MAQRGELEEALRALDTLLVTHPDDVQAKLFRGVVLTRSGDHAGAIAAFRALAAEHPELAEPHNNLAVLYAAEDRYEEARAALLKALDLQPEYHTAHENLGDIYAKLAVNAYEQAHRVNPENARARSKAQLLARAFALEPENAAGPHPRTAPAAGASIAVASRQEPQPAGAGSDTARGDSQHTPSEPAEPTPRVELCFAAERVEGEREAGQVVRWLATQGVEASTRARDEREVLNYKVWLAPVENRATALRLVDELREHGFEDVAPIGRGDQRNGIALGVYRTAEAAERRAARLRALGYQPLSAPRHRERRVYWVEVRATARQEIEQQLQAAFPRIAVRPHRCAR